MLYVLTLLHEQRGREEDGSGGDHGRAGHAVAAAADVVAVVAVVVAAADSCEGTVVFGGIKCLVSWLFERFSRCLDLQ